MRAGIYPRELSGKSRNQGVYRRRSTPTLWPIFRRSRRYTSELRRSEVSRRHRGPLLSIAKRLWPRWLIRRLLKRHGLYLLITAVKARLVLLVRATARGIMMGKTTRSGARFGAHRSSRHRCQFCGAVPARRSCTGLSIAGSAVAGWPLQGSQ